MNRTEIKALLQILSTAFPTHYKKLSVEEMKAQVSLYEMMFAEDDGTIVTAALKNYISMYIVTPLTSLSLLTCLLPLLATSPLLALFPPLPTSS